MASATLINSTSTSVNTSLNAASLSSSTGDNCVSNILCNNTTSLSIHNFNSAHLTDHPTRSAKISLLDINNNSSGNKITQNDLSNRHTTASNSNDLNVSNSTNVNNFMSNSPEMAKIRQSNSLSNSPQDYHSTKKTIENVISSKSYADTNLYSDVAMDIKVIDLDCVVYTYCSDVNIAIEDHFKKALNTNIFTKHKDSNDQISLPMNQRNLPASFWNSNYYAEQQPKQQSHSYQTNLVTDHSHHYLPLIEPSASTSSLQPLLQLETLSQLTHLQNHTQSSPNSTAVTNSTISNFPAANQHSTQNTSSLINNPINSLTFAHHLQHHHSQTAAADNFNTLDHQQLSESNAQLTATNFQPTLNQQSTDLTSQPQFLHHLLQQQNNHNPFHYTQKAAIQSSADHSHTFQQHSSLTAHYHNGSDTSNNNWSPHSAFVPLASPASSSSCSSNAENNVNRPNKLTNLTNGNSLSKQYDHLAKQTARFALTSSALLQLNSTGTSPNRSPLSTTTSSPAQVSHNSSTLSPIAFQSSNSSYQLTSLEKQRNSLFPNLASTVCNSLQNHSTQSNNSNESTNFSSNTATSPISTSSNSTLSTAPTTSTSSTFAKSFTHFAHQSATDHWTHPSNHSSVHQPYLAFHSAHNLASYHPPVSASTSPHKSGGANNSANYNQYNSLLLAGTNGSVNNPNSVQSAGNLKTTASNSLQHTLANPAMSNHLTNYNYYHLNPLTQMNSLTGTSAETSSASINFRHHHYHHNASNYNGYNNYNYGLAAMTGFDNQVTAEGAAKEIQYWF